MIDTVDLDSYYPGYDEYCEPKKTFEKYDDSDEYHENFMIRGGYEIMHRQIIDLSKTELTFEEIMLLKNYIWKNDKLIPIELTDGE